MGLMRRAAQIVGWMDEAGLGAWVQEAPDAWSLRRRLSIWLTYLGFGAATVAHWLQVSKQAVWLWVGQYNRRGPDGLERRGRGGRRWGFLRLEEEARVLERLEKRAAKGQMLTARQIQPWLSQAAGREVSLAYVYRVLHRHRWRKLAARPRHVRADVACQATFKKTFRRSGRRR